MALFFYFLLLASIFGSSFSSAARQPRVSNVSNMATGALAYTSPSSLVLPMRGNVYPLGYYSASISIGKPPRSFELDIDTGSDITWVQCDAPCRGCTQPPNRQYKPKRDNLVPCSDPVCRDVPGTYNCEKPTDQCDYEVEYGDQASSLGVLVKDQFLLSSKNGSLFSPTLTFGCGYDHNPGSHPLPPTAGILGLGRGKGSIGLQLRSLGITQNVIGHCLSRIGGGFFFFGGYQVPSSGISWTPMMPSGTHYASGSAELLFGGNPTGMKGLQFVFDSGSSYAYFNAQVYQATINMVKKNMAGKALKEAPEDSTLPVCWKAAKPIKSIAEVQASFKPLTIRFSNARSGLLELTPQDYLIVSKYGNACLGILNGGQQQLGNINIIGDIFMQDRMVIYDNEKQQIGWFPANCAAKS